jgi:hypothetical protein
MRKLGTMLVGIATFAALLLSATVANAQVTKTPIPNNGVTCYKHENGTYPQDGHYYYCGSSSSNETAILNTITTTLGTYSNVQTKLSGAQTHFFVFESAIDAAKWNTSVQNPPDADIEPFYDSMVDTAGVSFKGQGYAFIFENYATGVGNYPATSAYTQGQMQHSALHEMGHHYNYGSGTNPDNSATSEYIRVVKKDQKYMDETATSPNAASLRSTYGYFLNVGTDGWAELYAEEFANFVITDIGTSVAPYLAVDGAALTPYFKCSQLYVEKNITGNRTPNNSEYRSEGCMATCVAQDSASHTYPLDNTHAYVCYNDVSNRSQSVFNAIQQFPNRPNVSSPLEVGDLFQQQGVVIFTFQSRIDAEIWFERNPETGEPNTYQGKNFTGPADWCGHTGYSAANTGTGQEIAIAVYDECTINGVSELNPSMRDTTKHESGHAFEYAMASTKSSGRNDLISQSPGYLALWAYDKGNLTPSDWGTRSQMSKNSYICGASSTVVPSDLEVFLGASSGRVCSNATTPEAGYGSMTPQEIIEEKIPYFYTDSREFFAEQFALKASSLQNPATFLQLTNRLMSSNQGPIPNFKCTEHAVLRIYDNLLAPTSAQLSGQSCPSTPGSFNIP